MVTLLLLNACKKDSGKEDDTTATGYKKPASILSNWEYRGGTWQVDGFMLLDLDHADNKDKSFMVVGLQETSIDKYGFVLKKGPLPIDSLATNWPPEVRSVAFGYSNDLTVNAAMRLQAQTATRPYTYRYDSVHKFSTAIYLYNYLNNPLYAGSMAGKTPQGRQTAWAPDATGNAVPRDIIYYFKESAFSNVIAPGYGGIMLTDLVNGVNTPSEIWKKVDATITFTGTYYTHLYLDVDDWQYFTIRDWCPSSYGAKCDKGGVQYIHWRSMNELMNWPAGWGKK